jgi:catechol 2,3-dioxygenase-like lactoylglutathione lyase family enzyme
VDDAPRVTEMRLVVTASDYEEALRFYRDVLGLPERAAYSSPGGRVTILEAGRATLELAAAGATVIAEPTRTPWASLNARLEAPADLQLTLFTDDPV